jgi:hypothetical protein
VPEAPGAGPKHAAPARPRRYAEVAPMACAIFGRLVS